MNILVIGLGSIAKKHIDALYALELNATIYALRSSLSSERYKAVININSIQQIQGKIDFAIIANVTSAHESAILKVLEMDYQCPMMIEKPVLSDISRASYISEILDRKHSKTYVACNLRFHPGLLFLKKYLTDKKPRINEVSIYCGSYLPDWRPGTNFREIYSANAGMGGGAHLDLIHEIDYCTWLFGFPESKIQLNRTVSSLEIDSIDNARFMFIYPEFTVGINLNYYRKDIKRTIEIVTSHDTIVLDLVKNTLYSTYTGVKIYHEPFNMLDTYNKQICYFMDMLESKENSMNDFDYAVKVLKLANE